VHSGQQSPGADGGVVDSGQQGKMGLRRGEEKERSCGRKKGLSAKSWTVG
jgi:hypothetical protein